MKKTILWGWSYLSFGKWNLEKRIWIWNLATCHSATLHIAKFSVFHLNTVEVVSVITTNFNNLADSRVSDTRANVAMAIVSHLNGIVQAKSHNTINLNCDGSSLIVNDEHMICVTSMFQVHFSVLLRHFLIFQEDSKPSQILG